MNTHTLESLEFPTVQVFLQQRVAPHLGGLEIGSLTPCTSSHEAQQALGQTREAMAVLAATGRQPYRDLPDVAPLLKTLGIEGAHLEPAELLHLASFLEGAADIAPAILRCDEAPTLRPLAARIEDFSHWTRRVRQSILPSLEVADQASPALATLRRRITQLKSRLQSVMESLVKGKESDRLLQDRLITTRNDRQVLILKAEFRGQLPGIIHGSSSSGASFFVEPLPAVDLNNDIVAALEDERREVVRILTALTDDLALRQAAVHTSLSVLKKLDALQGKALLARDMGAVIPEISADGTLALIDARHPLLMNALVEPLGLPRRAMSEPIPLSVDLPPDQSVLIVSGPNAGGKTVALKTIGLLALMAQSGLAIPAAQGSTLPVFRRVYADIGDEQSILADLSTFSARLKAIEAMLRDIQLPTLILLDEVGSGTDPQEGGALGIALIEYLRRRGVTVTATTHHGVVKAYSQTTPGVRCASFGYDPANYLPTYRLKIGSAGRSLAFEMAERFGLPAELLADARAHLDVKQQQVETLLASIEKDRAQLVEERDALAQERQTLADSHERLQSREQELARAQGRVRSEYAAELKARLKETTAELIAITRAAERRAAAGRKDAQRARDEGLAALAAAHQQALSRAGLEPPQAETHTPQVGERVRLTRLGVVGRVQALSENEIEVDVEGKRLRLPRGETMAPLSAPGAPRASRSARVIIRESGASVATDINIVGLTVEDALPRVDKLLDEAILGDRAEVRVIHGFGRGRVRQAVAGFLMDHPQVAASRVAADYEGGAGVTIVSLKD
ncbi:MAG: Smr/MutS family protein [Vicinamibacteria bacterium]|nr:Smr/MutS family protein [Vicinamibacteria bacterium]